MIIRGPDGLHRTGYWALDGQFYVQVVDPPQHVTGAVDVEFADEPSRWTRSIADDALLAELESHRSEPTGPRQGLFSRRS